MKRLWLAFVAVLLALAACSSSVSAVNEAADIAANESADGTAGSDESVAVDGTEETATTVHPWFDLGFQMPLSDIQQELMTPRSGRTPVTFTFDAPEASRVELEMTANYWNASGTDSIQLERVEGEETSHAITLHMGEGQWLYRFRVDGWRWEADPINPNSVGAELDERNSVLQVGESLPMVTADTAVPQGEVQTVMIESQALDKQHPLVVYTPPGFRPADGTPLLILLHGFGQPGTDWTEAVGINHAADNLRAAAAIDDIVIAMPSAEQGFYQGRYATHILTEVLPLMQNEFGVGLDKSTTAIGGFSAGGYGAVHLAYQAQDQIGLSIPIAMAALCFNNVCDQVSDYERAYPEPFDVEFAMFAGVDDELDLDVNHRVFLEFANNRGMTASYTEAARTQAHRREGHSIRYVRTIADDVLLAANEFFTGSE